MPISLPTPAELEEYKEQGPSDSDVLQRSSDLFTIATGIKDEPTDPFEARLIRTAILEMSIALQAEVDNRDANFSGITSETIGSYSYSRTLRSVRSGDPTNVSAFDQAVDYFKSKQPSIISISSEWVFKPGYENEFGSKTFHDPSESFATGELVVPEGGSFHTTGDVSVTFDEFGFPIVEVEGN